MEGRPKLRLRDGALAECPQGVKTPYGSGGTSIHPRWVCLCPRRTAQPHESLLKLLRSGGSTHPEPQYSGGPDRCG
jgi:hypothetical protein